MSSRKFSCLWGLTIASGGIVLNADCLWVDVLLKRRQNGVCTESVSAWE